MSKRASIVVTTIYEPDFLDGYVADILRNGREETTEIIVIPDRKTPPSLYERCAELARGPVAVLCPDISAQEEFLRGFPSLDGRLPFNTDHRRNVGFLMALDRGADVLISIDDDNYCGTDGDFVGAHCVVGEPVEAPVVEAEGGWFNICSMLDCEPRTIYPRGYPYGSRSESPLSIQPGSVTAAINVGLWTGDPDVDAMTRLTLQPACPAMNSQALLLGRDTWSPINTQNTALRREAIAAYWYVRMGHSLGGLSIDRFGDILAGYFCARCVKTMGEGIRVGTPVLDHRRNTHNLFKDLFHELAGMVVVEDLLPWLVDVKLEGDTYAEVYGALAHALEESAPRFRGFVWDDGGRDFLVATAEDMRAWLEAVITIG